MFSSNIDAVATLTFMAETPTLRDRIAAGILDTAAAVLAGRGESASMAEIADAAGVSRATLYRYFPTRDTLLNALAEAASAELRDRIADAELDTIPVPEAIARLTRGFVLTGSKYVALAHSGHKPPDAGQTQLTGEHEADRPAARDHHLGGHDLAGAAILLRHAVPLVDRHAR